MGMTLWIMVGAPASGKTTFAKQHLAKDDSWAYISRDEVRFSIITEQDKYFSKEKEVFKTFINSIIKNLKNPDIHNVIADATHLNWQSRNKLLQAIPTNLKKSLDIIPIVIEAEPRDIIERNKARTGLSKLSDDALRIMYKRFTDPKTDPYKYTAIMYTNTSEQLEVVEQPKIFYTKEDIKIKPMTLKSLIQKKREELYGRNMDNF